MKINVHYHPDNGEIIGWDTSHFPRAIAGGYVFATVEADEKPSPALHKFDAVAGAIVDKSDAEKQQAAAPSAAAVAGAIARELALTDPFMNPPSDRPRRDGFEFDWKPYRQALRDLSKLRSPSAMIAAWPSRPDGAPAPRIRK